MKLTSAARHLELMIQSRWNLIQQIKLRKDMTKVERRQAENMYKLDIEALQLAIDTIRHDPRLYEFNKGYEEGDSISLNKQVDRNKTTYIR